MWSRFLTAFAATALAALLAAATAIALIDPLGISPVRIVSDQTLPDSAGRLAAPVIVRGGRYDSFVIGTSTIHTLDPMQLEAILPGHFANLSLFGSTPHEQRQLVLLIGRERPQTRLLIWGLGADWCSADSKIYNQAVPFPEWLYDDNRWNDLMHAFNSSTLELSRRKLLQRLGWRGKPPRPDGFIYALPPDGTYILADVQPRIYGSAVPRQLMPAPTALVGSAESGAGLAAVRILEDALSRLPAEIHTILVLLPVHAVAQPAPGSAGEQALEDCKAAIAGIANRRGHWVLDALWRSAWTVDDNNFWDQVHFRDRLRDMLIRAIDRVVNKGEAEGPLRVLARGRR